MSVLFEKICRHLDLGMPISPPAPLTGGLLHQMYALHTPKGRYALKLLDPAIMKRETAMENYRLAEELERRLEQSPVPILPALTLLGRKMQETEGRFYYLFPWYEGKALRPEEITQMHRRRIGGLLAAIHGIDRKPSFPPAKGPSSICGPQDDACGEGALPAQEAINWDHYIRELENGHRALSLLLRDNRTLLYASKERCNRAIGKIPPVLAICHNDLDCKNVLWKGSDCRIIDLECLSYACPFSELYETALHWSGYEQDAIDPHQMESFLRAYAEGGGSFPEDWEIFYDSCHGRLEWLEYNIRRVLDMEECTAAQREISLLEIPKTMAHAICYERSRDAILQCLERFTAPAATQAPCFS